MTTRLLPPSEWAKLAGTELGGLALDPETTRVLVIEQDGQIIACWALLQVLHAEGVWIHPEHRRKGRTAARLWQGMRELVTSTGALAVVTSAVDTDVRALIERQGGRPVAGEHFVMPMEALCQRS